MSIKEELNQLRTNDTYSLILFVLYKLRNVPEYSGVSELAYVLDESNFLNLCEYFGGLTITIPTVKEIKDMSRPVNTKEEIAQYIADLAHLKYEIVESVNDIDVNDDAASTTIYLIPKISNEVNNGYDEYFVVNGVLEKIGSLDIDLSNYV
jgi:hypothetical protein